MKLSLAPITAAVLLALYTGQASAQAALPEMSFCSVSMQDACAGGVSFNAETRAVLTIVGRFVGPANIQLSGGSIVLEHVDTGRRATLALNPVADPRVAAANLASSDEREAPTSTWGTALEAILYTASLQPGDYRVVSATVIPQGGGEQQIPLNLNNGARFTIVGSAGSSQGVVLKDAQGSVVANLRPRATNGQWVMEGYPALRNGNYTIEANIGPSHSQKNFVLERPTRSYDVDLPAVEGLPEVAVRVTSIDPLRNQGISGTFSLVNDSAYPITVGGTQIAPGGSFAADFNAGNAVLSVGSQSTTGTTSIDLFNLAPDGENIRLNVARWKLEDQFAFKVNKSSAAIKVDTVVISPDRLPTATKCTKIRTYRDGDRLFETDSIQCAVEWLDRKGLEFDRFQPGVLRGELQEPGDNQLRYRFGVIYTNPQTKQTAFYPSSEGTQSLVLTGTVPQIPELTFSPYVFYAPAYARMNPPNNKKLVRLTPADSNTGNLVGNVTVRAPYPGLRTRVTAGENSREYLTSFTSASYPILSKISDSLGEQEVVIETWYDKAPEYKQELRFTAVGIPMGVSVFPDRDILSHTEADTVLTGQVGVSKGTRIEYDAQRDGVWEVSFFTVDGSGELGQKIGSATVQSDGRYSANLGRLTVGQRRLRPVATLIANGQPTTLTTQSAQDIFLNTFDGRAPTVTVEAKTDNGSVPFSATASLKFAEPSQAAVADLARWEFSRDAGATWEQLLDDRGRPVVGSTAVRRFTEAGDYMMRARVANKYSGLSTVTDAVALTAFMRGNIRFEAPSAAAINRPVTIRATPVGFGQGYDMRWAITRGSTAATNVEQNGDTFTFTPTQADSYTIRVGVKDRNAPDTAQAWLYRDVSVRAVNPLSASATISGPTHVEAGKTYRYTAHINDVVPEATSKNYTIRGAWLMPDGTRVESESIDYTIQPGQTAVVFVTWVDGAPQNERVNTFAVRSWQYVWPNWTMDLRVDEQSVPASIRYTIRPTDVALVDLHGEPLDVTWSLPENTTVSQQGLSGRIVINSVGRYQLVAQVSDSRGNVTNITSPEIEILPAPSVTGRLEVISPFGENKFFAPCKCTISYRIESLPRGDRFRINELMVNGEKVGEFPGTSAIVDIASAGQYTIGVRTLTQQGNFGQTEKSITMAEAPKPTCTIARPSGSTGTTLTPTCTVEAGAIASYEWNYLLRGESRKVTSRSLFIRSSDYGSVSNLSLTVTTTLGASETFTVTPPTRQN